MQENIISSIYNAYLDNEFEDIQPLRPNDLQSGYEKLNDFEKKHNISTSEQNELYTDILNEFTAISEMKGFTNGFIIINIHIILFFIKITPCIIHFYYTYICLQLSNKLFNNL